MKLLTTLLLLSSTIIHAKEIAHYRFAVRDNTNQELILMEVSVDDQKELIVKSKIYESSEQGPIFFPTEIREEMTVKKELNQFSFDAIFYKVKNLANTAIEISEHQIVCAMMPGPTASNDHLSVLRDWSWDAQDFLGSLELVSGPQGCWVSRKVQPKEQWAKQQALNLKEIIRVLALDTLE